MKGRLSERVTPLMTSAMKIACCSLSITHGPAIRKRLPDPMRMDSTWKETLMSFEFQVSSQFSKLETALPARHFHWPMEHLHFCGLLLFRPFLCVLVGRPYECPEERMRLQRLRLKFGMELAPNEVGMVRQFDHFNIRAVWGGTGDSQACRGQLLFIFAIELVTMAVALAN